LNAKGKVILNPEPSRRTSSRGVEAMSASVARFGGLCGILTGVCYLIVGIDYFLQPAAQRPGGPFADYAASVAAAPVHLKVQSASFALAAFLTFGVIMALTEALRKVDEGLIRWATALGHVGCVALILAQVRMFAVGVQRAAAYLEGDAAVKAAIAWNNAPIDPHGWLGFGSIGAYILVACLMGLRGGALLSSGQCYVGVAIGLLSFLVVIGLAAQAPLLVAVGAGLGGVVLGPIWYIWIGLTLRRHGEAQTAARAA
jgi:hypothetical protein